MKVIFLDIDGVLNGHEFCEHAKSCGINPECVCELNRIIAATDAKIVLSSAWRYMVHGGALTLKGFEYMLRTHGVTENWLLLTKRPERAAEYFEKHATRHIWAARASEFSGRKDGALGTCDHSVCNCDYPLPNVWLGTSCEDQQRADERIPHLLRCPAAVRFLSVEPLIGPVGLRSGIYSDITNPNGPPRGTTLEGIDWIIVGAESGAGRRPMKIEWARSLRDQCKAAGVAFFMKQLEVDGKITGDIEKFPEDLRIRQMPRVRTPAAATI